MIESVGESNKVGVGRNKIRSSLLESDPNKRDVAYFIYVRIGWHVCP